MDNASSQMTPEEAKASLGTATHLITHLMPQGQAQESTPQKQTQKTEEAPKAGKGGVETKMAEMELNLTKQLDGMRKEMKDDQQREMDGLKKVIEDALNK